MNRRAKNSHSSRRPGKTRPSRPAAAPSGRSAGLRVMRGGAPRSADRSFDIGASGIAVPLPHGARVLLCGAAWPGGTAAGVRVSSPAHPRRPNPAPLHNSFIGVKIYRWRRKAPVSSCLMLTALTPLFEGGCRRLCADFVCCAQRALCRGRDIPSSLTLALKHSGPLCGGQGGARAPPRKFSGLPP